LYRVLSGSIPEKIAYRRASDSGLALTETGFPSLNDRADPLAQSVVDFVATLGGRGRAMVRIPPPRGEGEPLQESDTMGNLDAPASEELVLLNFKVPASFR
jgi:hypothetical protein